MAAPMFIFGGDTGVKSPKELKRLRAIAEALAGPERAPQNLGEGLNAIGQALLYRSTQGKANKIEEEGEASAKASMNPIMDALRGGSSAASGGKVADALFGKPEAASEMAATAPGGGSYRDAIASIESAGSGDYSAVGPTNEKMGRPLGRYQVMESNIPSWSREALGREVSAEEFLKSPEIQDKVFDHRFQTYVDKYGPEGAAQAWLGGPGSVGKTERRDVLGTSVGEYGSRFMNALGPQQEVASLDPRAGMAQPQTAAQAVEAQAPAQGGSLSDEVAEFRNSPEYAAAFPGRQQAAAQPPQNVGPAPTVAGPQTQPQAAPQQVAQAGPMQQPQQSGPSLPQLYEAMQNPWLNEGQRALVESEIQRQQQMQDPAYQQNMQLRQAQINALSRKTEKSWARLDDNTLFNPETGETKSVPLDPNRPSSDLGLNPQYGVDANGSPVLLQLGKDGRTVQSQLPQGVTLSKEPIKLDAGTHFVLLDPITRQPVGQIPKDNRQEAADKAGGTVEGKARAEAASGLSSVQAVGKQITDQIDDVLNDPNLDSAVGSLQGRLPSFRQGSVDFDKKLERLQGQAFLQAREFLKGQGPITDFESRKAEAASVQLSTAQSEDQFRQALKDFKDAVASGVQKAQMAANGGQIPAAAPTAAPAGPNVDDLLQKYGPK